MLSIYGRRIERLLYLGFVLILFCFVEIYLSSIAVYFSDAGDNAVQLLIYNLENDKEPLSEAYNNQIHPELKIAKDARSRSTAVTRKALGLPPETVDDDGRAISYGEMLTNLVPTNIETRKVQLALKKLLDHNRSPSDILAEIKKYQEDNLNKSGVVWGIETPRSFLIQYGGSGSRVPSKFLAISLLVALYPIVVIWFGSFYITRQRELLGIRELDDYRLSFPHILNLLPVVFIKNNQRLGIKESQREQFINRRINTVLTTSMRCTILLLFIIPVFGSLVYSSINLYSISLDIQLAVLLLLGFTIFLLLIIVMMIIFQEIVSLHGKVFYA